MPALLPFPPPYRAWLTLSNDPDNTVEADWVELHETIWGEFGLPFGDSVFLRSINETLPDQVSVETLPRAATAHPVDTLHSWGDYILSTQEAFHRARAVEALETLAALELEPRVWVDHSFFQGNVLHTSHLGSLPKIEDASGHVYENSLYTLDLVVEAGVRYVWDTLVRRSFPRPGRPTPAAEYFAARTGSATRGKVFAVLQKMGNPAWRWARSERFDYRAERTKVCYPHTFPDGRTLYCFSRYGGWEFADIHGFGQLTRASELDRIVAAGAACIVYTHLGKRRAQDMSESQHIPASTRESLGALRDRHRAGQLMVSPTSQLLDYCVLRDHARVQGNTVDFRADGIRWQSLGADDLAGHRFGVAGVKRSALRVTCEGQPLEVSVGDEAGAVAFEVAP